MVARILQGDRDALAHVLVDICGPDVRWMMSHFGHPDLLGELCVAILNNDYRSLRSWRGEVPLRGWVRGVATKICLAHIRKKKRQTPGGGGNIEDVPAPAANPVPPTGTALDSGCRNEALEKAIGMLKPRERVLVHLHYFRHLPLDAIAEHLGESRDSVYKIHQRTKERLKELMKA
jgi:RNA polymerase sigma factor (sigma-70 family)